MTHPEITVSGEDRYDFRGARSGQHGERRRGRQNPKELEVGGQRDVRDDRNAGEFGWLQRRDHLPTGFDHDDYPNLIEMETEIPSVATGMVLLAASSKDAPGHADRVAQLVDTLFSRFGELKKDGRHPKWREINLAASLPGWTGLRRPKHG